jgi:MFS family permease
MTSSSTQPAKPSWRDAITGNVLMVGLVSLFTDFSSEMMNPLLPIFIAGLVPLGMAPLFVGLTEGIAETTASILKLFAGRLSDKLGKRKALVVFGYSVSAVSRPLISLAGLIGTAFGGVQVIGLKFFDRIGKGVRTSPRDALVSDTVPLEVRGLAFSVTRAMDHAGAVLGSVAAAILLYFFLGRGLWAGSSDQPGAEEMSALRWVFALAAIPGIIGVIALITRVREVAPKNQAPDAGRRKGGWRILPARFYAFTSIVTIFTLGNSSDMFLLLFAWSKFHFGLLAIIGMWIALHISKIVFSIPGGVLADKLGRRPMILAGWSMYALVYLGLAMATMEWHFWALFVAYGFYYGMSEGAEKALVADFVPSEHRGTAFGIYNGAVGIAALPASLVFGVFWTVIGPAWAFGIGAALAGLASLMLVIFLAATGA